MNHSHRPQYHFSPDGWMNDPVPFFWNGEYHNFYQINPHGAFAGAYEGVMCWGHARSRDGVLWEELPIALSPTPGGYDGMGCWTGCIVEHNGIFYAFYTGIPQLEPKRIQTQCLATSRDLIHWTKHPANPLISEEPAGIGDCFRDPHVWKEANEWMMIIGSDWPGQGGTALLYRSPDLVHWEYLHPLTTGKLEETLFEWECPDFFMLDGKHVLLHSRRHNFWQVGEYRDHRFAPNKIGITDGGNNCLAYAGKTLLDDRGRRVLYSRIREESEADAQRVAGWSGVLSLPRVLSISEDGALIQEPLPELEKLRGKHRHFENLKFGAGNEVQVLEGIEGDTLELLIRFAPLSAASNITRLGVRVLCAQDGSGGTEIVYDREARTLGTASFELQAGEELGLRIWIDRSIVETFANGRACKTDRYYPTEEKFRHLALFAYGGETIATTVDAWQLTATRTSP